MIEPRISPNLNQNLFGTSNTLGNTIANKKKMVDITNAQIRNPSELIKGYKEMIKNTIEKTIPKDFDEGSSVGILLFILDIDKQRNNIVVYYKDLCVLKFKYIFS